jgi:hypothetical protein
VFAALSYQCMWPKATSAWGLQPLVYAALSYYCIRPYATCVCGREEELKDALHRTQGASGVTPQGGGGERENEVLKVEHENLKRETETLKVENEAFKE